MFPENWLLIANRRTSLIGASLIAGLCWAAQPAQAAQFVYTSPGGSANGSTYLAGVLSFEASNLSGIGEERVSFAELVEAAANAGAGTRQPSFDLSLTVEQWLYPSVVREFWEFFASHEDNPLFTFINGELVGIDVDLRPNLFFSGGFGRYIDSCCFYYYGEAFSQVRGNQFSVTVKNYTSMRIYPFTGITEYLYTSDVPFSMASGTFDFYTLESLSPGVAIPEPMTVLGLGVAAGLGGWARSQGSQSARH